MNLRDQVANKLCNFLLNHVATKSYRDKLAAIYGLGIVELQDLHDKHGNDKPGQPFFFNVEGKSYVSVPFKDRPPIEELEHWLGHRYHHQ